MKEEKTMKSTRAKILSLIMAVFCVAMLFACDERITVTFSANGGTFENGETEIKVELNKDSLLIEPKSPTRTGYTLLGFSEDEDGVELWNFKTDKATENLTLYAIWNNGSTSNNNADNGTNGNNGTENTAPHTHTEVTIPAIAATCNTNGKTEGKKCSVCNEILITPTPISATENHDYITSVIEEATCISTGTQRLTCKNCPKTITETYSKQVYSSTELFEYVSDSIAEIITYDKSGNEFALGSGFVYSADGKIITNYHVIEESYSAKVNVNGKTYTVSKVLAYDKDIDIAVLKIDATNLPVIPICDKTVKTGINIYAFGSSKGFTATFSNGIITHAEREEEGVVYVQHNAAISSGNSGGPLINEFGEIIGINTFTIKDSQNLNFAIFVSELDNLSYGTPMTLPEVYEKECDVFQKLVNYAIAKGTYDAEDGDYYVLTGFNETNDGTCYYRSFEYNKYDGTITFNLLIDSDYLVGIEIDEIDGIYDWYYIDYYDNYMSGTLYAATYTNDSLLGYSYYDIPSSSLVTSVRKLASSMVDLICTGLDMDFTDINITAYDLGFYIF